jgi:chromosome segregation ATPase
MPDPTPAAPADVIRAYIKYGGYEVVTMSDGIQSAVPMDKEPVEAALASLLAELGEERAWRERLQASELREHDRLVAAEAERDKWMDDSRRWQNHAALQDDRATRAEAEAEELRESLAKARSERDEARAMLARIREAASRHGRDHLRLGDELAAAERVCATQKEALEPFLKATDCYTANTSNDYHLRVKAADILRAREAYGWDDTERAALRLGEPPE